MGSVLDPSMQYGYSLPTLAGMMPFLLGAGIPILFIVSLLLKKILDYYQFAKKYSNFRFLIAALIICTIPTLAYLFYPYHYGSLAKSYQVILLILVFATLLTGIYEYILLMKRSSFQQKIFLVILFIMLTALLYPKKINFQAENRTEGYIESTYCSCAGLRDISLEVGTHPQYCYGIAYACEASRFYCKESLLGCLWNAIH